MTALRFLVWFAGTILMVIGAVTVGTWLSQSWPGRFAGIAFAVAFFADAMTGWSRR